MTFSNEKLKIKLEDILSRRRNGLDTIPVDRKYPLLVSYPRSGSHWINAMMEISLDRSRGPDQTGGITWRSKKANEDYLWFHCHDKKLTQPKSNSELGDIFLFRNPIDCLYSLQSINPYANIVEESHYYKNNFEKWISMAKTVLIYEYAVKDPYGCLELGAKHFNIPFEHDKAKLAVETCTKEAIMTKIKSAWHSDKNLTEQYKNNKTQFIEKHANTIKTIVATEITKPWLSKIMDLR